MNLWPLRVLPVSGQRRLVLRRVFGSLLSSAAIQLTLLITGVLLARALGPEDRGQFARYTVIVLIALQIGPLGLQHALVYTLARFPGHATSTVRLIRGLYARRCVAAGAVAGLTLLLVARPAGSYLLALGLFALAIPFGLLHQASLAVLQGLKDFKALNVQRIFPQIAFTIACVAMVIAGNGMFLEFSIAWVASRVLAGSISFVVARQQLKLQRRRQDVGRALPTRNWMSRFGLRSVLGAAAPVETYRLDQAVVALVLPPAALGFYVAASAFTNPLRFLGQSVGLVAVPHVASTESLRARRRAAGKFLALTAAIAIPPALLLWFVGPALVRPFFGSAFDPANQLVQPLVAAAFFYCLRRSFSDAVRGAGFPGIGSAAEVFAVLSAGIGFAVLIPSQGVYGAALALAAASGLAFCFLCVLFAIASSNLFPVRPRKVHHRPSHSLRNGNPRELTLRGRVRSLRSWLLIESGACNQKANRDIQEAVEDGRSQQPANQQPACDGRNQSGR